MKLPNGTYMLYWKKAENCQLKDSNITFKMNMFVTYKFQFIFLSHTMNKAH